jgi:hypothetical protein
MTSSSDAKATMKAVRIHAFGGPEELRYEDAPRPVPKSGEVLIRIHASRGQSGGLEVSQRFVRQGLSPAGHLRIRFFRCD